MTTIKDVAKVAGVSFKTVSRVMNDDPAVRPVTRAKVMDAVAQLDYRPNAIAQGLRSQRTNTIGFVSDEVATTPFAGRIILGAQEAAWQQENLLLLVNTGNDKAMKRAAVNMLLDRKVDGIIYATMYHREVSPPSNVHKVPTVLLDCFVADGSLPAVVPDEVQGGYVAVKHLLEKGHRRIGFLNNDDDIPASFGRLQGYKNALANHDVPFDAQLVTHSVAMRQNGYECAKQLLQLAEPPTAIFCFNDRMTIGVYAALRELGLSIPDDIAVVGFDNQELIANEASPLLTTVALPHYEMGQWAVEHLLKLINLSTQEKKKPVQQLITCPLIMRDSA